MKIHIDQKPRTINREQRSLYIYFDHHFKVSQVVRPSEKFQGSYQDWKDLAYAIAPNHYKYEVK